MSLSETLAGNITVVAGGDVYDFLGSGAITEGRLVELNTTVTDPNGQNAVVQQASANSASVIGYVEATYEASDRVKVRTGGIARLYNNSGLTISAGTLIGAGSAGTIKGYGALASSSGTVVGVTLESISTATFGRCLVRNIWNPIGTG